MVFLPRETAKVYPKVIQLGCKCYSLVEPVPPYKSSCPDFSWDDVTKEYAICEDCSEDIICSVEYFPCCFAPSMKITVSGNGPTGTNTTVNWCRESWTPAED